MNYHNITHDDMLNGEGLRVVLWVSGCEHNCKGCHNPQTHDENNGVLFDKNAEDEIFQQLDKDYISGITFSGGDPLHENNAIEILELIRKIKSRYASSKTIWLYTGFTIDEICNSQQRGYTSKIRKEILNHIDMLVDGRFVESLKDEKYHWAGSTNQRVIKKEDFHGYLNTRSNQ